MPFRAPHPDDDDTPDSDPVPVIVAVVVGVTKDNRDSDSVADGVTFAVGAPGRGFPPPLQKNSSISNFCISK